MEGWRARCSSCGGTRQHNSISHVGVGEVGVQAAGAAHSGIVIGGGGGRGGADKVERNGSFPNPPVGKL